MAIAPLPPISLPSVGALPAMPTSTPAATAGESGQSFGDQIGNALQSLSDAHTEVDQLAVKAATGDLTAVHDFTIATTEVQLMTQLTVEIRNKAIESFNDIMRMQV
ncbi:MAG: flagellar hook-basal body complex protein FliE [Ilumatobacter sp.]|jgi:flagellar hook-basal body complex protein FliE|uniref:flagellar hook-basal body complex protein FliE n=1 Tax=Ilumatobacter sp. TaxID=1967498 RepID=UPI00391BE68A